MMKIGDSMENVHFKNPSSCSIYIAQGHLRVAIASWKKWKFLRPIKLLRAAQRVGIFTGSH